MDEVLLVCLENLRTLVEFNTTVCFNLTDIYRANFFQQHWLQLIGLVFCRQARIRILDRHTYTLVKPIAVLEALSMIHDWSCTNMPTWVSDPCAVLYDKRERLISSTWSHHHQTTLPKPRVNG